MPQAQFIRTDCIFDAWRRILRRKILDFYPLIRLTAPSQPPSGGGRLLVRTPTSQTVSMILRILFDFTTLLQLGDSFVTFWTNLRDRMDAETTGEEQK